MLTSTVKHVSGPPQPQQSARKWQVASNQLRQLFGRKTYSFGTRTTGFAAGALFSLAAFSSVNGQTLNVRVSVPSLAPARIHIDASLPRSTNSLSFPNTYAGVIGLGERIETVEGVRNNGERVRVQRLAPGEFRAAEELSRFTYDVNLAEAPQPAQQSHVSSLNRDRGILMMADLLPQSTRSPPGLDSVLLDIDAPSGWKITSNVGYDGRQYWTDEPDSAVFLIGPSLHEKRQRLATSQLSLISSGKWPFSEDDAGKIAARIFEEYSRITQFVPKRNAVLMLAPYSGEAGPESWSAETRGNVVVLLLGRKATGRRVLARLGIVLSHEFFHLWVPNSLSLKGDYDWFFEGFTLYQALRTDLRLGLISFDDFLETIAGVYDSYKSSVDNDTLSLIEASERRWTTSSSMVYEKGMLVAFIYDLTLRNLTGCGGSLDGIYADLFRLPGAGQGSANETIIRILSERDGLKSFARDYVEIARGISLDATLASYGIAVQPGTSGTGATKLVVSRDLDKAQRKLLTCIGYKR